MFIIQKITICWGPWRNVFSLFTLLVCCKLQWALPQVKQNYAHSMCNECYEDFGLKVRKAKLFIFCRKTDLKTVKVIKVWCRSDNSKSAVKKVAISYHFIDVLDSLRACFKRCLLLWWAIFTTFILGPAGSKYINIINSTST